MEGNLNLLPFASRASTNAAEGDEKGQKREGININMGHMEKVKKNAPPRVGLGHSKVQGVFFIGPPPKMSKYRKVNLS